MPDDVIEGVAELSSWLQPSVNLNSPVTAFMLNCYGNDVSPKRDDGSGKPCAVDCATISASDLN